MSQSAVTTLRVVTWMLGPPPTGNSGPPEGAGDTGLGRSQCIGYTVPENRWFRVRSADRRKPRLKASFQPRSARGISERGSRRSSGRG